MRSSFVSCAPLYSIHEFSFSKGFLTLTELRIMATRPRLNFLAPLRRPHYFRRYATESRLASDHVRIVEVGPRDGLQNEKKSISKETKLDLIQRLAKTGVTTIEAGSFVPAKWVPQVCILAIAIRSSW